jgi:hypothetical protein
MKPKLILILFTPLILARCASNSNPPGPEGTGDHKTGYNLGRSDAVKQQYWMVQNLQKQPKTPQPKVTDLPITIPAETTNGVTTVPHTETVRIEQ